MMTMERVSIGALVLTLALAVVGVVQLSGQKAAPINGDFRNAAVAEVQDAQGQPLLRGSFIAADGDDQDEVERKAALAPVTAGSAAKGEAEVEYDVNAPATQDIELSASGLTAGAQVSLVIDGTTIATATADRNGTVEIDVEARSAAAQ